MEFSKYEGLGNDFVILDRPDIDAKLAIELCDRRRGIGADGVICVRQITPQRYGMKIFNADGSVPEMCGNGLRCVAQHLKRRRPGLGHEVWIETDAGLLRTTKCDEDILASVGPVTDLGPREISFGESVYTGRLISTGNPHFVLFGEFSQEDRESLGPFFETHETFPEGANISFATARDHTISLTVWERGCGFTQACGTGACATVAAGWILGTITTGQPVTVSLPGGTLEISGSLEDIVMRGPANHVFDGRYNCSTGSSHAV